MDLDTGAAVSVMNSNDFRKLSKVKNEKLRTSDKILRSYSGQIISCEGIASVNITYDGKEYIDDLYVIKGHNGPPLLGRTWLRKIKLDWNMINMVSSTGSNIPVDMSSQVHNLKKEYSDVFDNTKLGKMKDIKATLNLKPDAVPKFIKARHTPYILKKKIEEELDRLVKLDVLVPVKHSKWATPVVPVSKPDGSIRLCGDFSVSVNPQLNVDVYPQPRREELFAKLAGGKKFSKIDLSNAYLQMEVDDESKEILTINTSKGLFRFNRLPYGVSPASAIFQCSIEQIMQGLDKVLVFQDDILITGDTDSEHMATLNEVFRRLRKYGLTVKSSKVTLFSDSVHYLGYKIDAKGVHVIDDRIEAISKAPAPENINQLRSFLGTVNYYSSFISNISSRLAPLYKLLNKDVKWTWSKEADTAFNDVKNCLTQAPILCHYDPSLPIKLACDASPYGVGCVLSHVFPDGTERPVAYASKSLTPAEKNYSQLDREALSIVSGIKKFNDYLFGRKFTLVTDNQPLSHIFRPGRGVPMMASARLQRWALYLGAHSYDIEFRPSSKHANCDGLSRLPLKNNLLPRNLMDDVDMYYMESTYKLPVTATDIAKETLKDPLLCKVYYYTYHGWDLCESPVKELAPYYNRRNEISIIQGCLTWGIRIIIPNKYRHEILEELHAGHMGIVRMKEIARSYVYWPLIDLHIENKVNECSGCFDTRKVPAPAELHPWEYPSTKWSRIHLDFAGPMFGFMFLILVDAHSKWPEVVKLNTATSATTIKALDNIFSRFGLPLQIVTDNGSQFTSDEFSQYLKSNGIQHITTATGHPATNGQAERFVQTLKYSLKSSGSTPQTVDKDLSKFLMAYRNSPHSTTGRTPTSLLLGGNVKGRLDLLIPSTSKRVLKDQQKQVEYRNSKSKTRSFEMGDKVLAKDLRQNTSKWQYGTILKRTGPVSYMVHVRNVNGDLTWKRHVDQLLAVRNPSVSIPKRNPIVSPTPEVTPEVTHARTPIPIPEPNQITGTPLPAPHTDDIGAEIESAATSSHIATSTQIDTPVINNEQSEQSIINPPSTGVTELRRSQRTSVAPKRYGIDE